MKKIFALCFALVAAAAGAETLNLTNGWSLQSSAKLNTGGAVISTPDFQPAGWYSAKVPSTVVGCLADQVKSYSEAFFGTSFRSLPGVDYPIGANFSGRAMPDRSPFKVAWWYRTEFTVTPPAGGQAWLNFDGINYRANIWLNGKLIADDKQVAGHLSNL